MAIAGLTTYEAFFVLEGFGNDAGLRRAFSAEHRIEADRIEHRLCGPAALVQHASLARCGARWSEQMALLVNRCPLLRQAPIEARATSWLQDRANGERNRLFSWVLTPVRRPS